MIKFYTGTPGSGKSLRATREILLYLEKGRNVIANYPIIMTKRAVKKGGTFYYWDIKEMTSDNLKAFHKKHHKRIKGREEETTAPHRKVYRVKRQRTHKYVEGSWGFLGVLGVRSVTTRKNRSGG